MPTRESLIAEIASLEQKLASKKATLDTIDRAAATGSRSLRYVLIPKAAELTGYTKDAIQVKIARGVWAEGREWRKAPDGRRMVDLEGVMRWVESHQR